MKVVDNFSHKLLILQLKTKKNDMKNIARNYMEEKNYASKRIITKKHLVSIRNKSIKKLN